MTIYGDAGNNDLVIECNECEKECWRLTDLSNYTYPQCFPIAHRVLCKNCYEKKTGEKF